ncbi:MAG: phosphomannomutase/phosphoglucomutase [Candidatus Bathyarchaeia archaeon]
MEARCMIFRAYDVRGTYPEEVNEEVALKIGKAFGTYNTGKIVVGTDTRLSSPALKEALIRGLISTGAEVTDIGVVTTPMVIFATVHLKQDGGVMVTASHNPKEYNGFKFNDGRGIPISYESGIREIQKIYNVGYFSVGEGKLNSIDIIEDYAKFLLERIKVRAEGLKVVVDAGNGSAGLIYPKVLRELGASVYELNCEPDGNFPNRDPDPANRASLLQLQRKVVEVGADIGFAYDVDGDRLAVVDEKGSIMEPKKVFALLVDITLGKKPATKVVHDILTSMAIEERIRKRGGIPIPSKVGHTYIAQKLLEEGAALAGELSGHYYFEETFGADDALFASLRLIEYLVATRTQLSEYGVDIPSYFAEDMRVPIRESEKFNYVEKLRRRFQGEGYRVDCMDGVKVFFDDGWLVVRPSHTEPKISVAYEAVDKWHFEYIKRLVREILDERPR